MNSQVADPQFAEIDPATVDGFALQDGSPAIDSGTDVGLTTGIDGHAVPAGLAPDVGVCEAGSSFVSTATPTSAVSPTPTPAVIEIPVMEDGFVDSDTPSTNYGSSTVLSTDGGPSIKVSYLKFDLTTLATVQFATLRFRVADQPGADSTSTQHVKEVADNSWTEGTLTYDTRPVVGTTLGSNQGGVQGQVKEVDVTASVASHAGGIYSIAIDQVETDGMEIYAKDSGPNAPTLVIEGEQVDAAPPQTPTDTATPTPTEPPTPVLAVNYLQLSLSQKGPSWAASATAGISDETGAATKDAVVTGAWQENGAVIAAGLVETSNGRGEARFSNRKLNVSRGDAITFIVTDVSKSGYVWDGVSSSDTVVVP